MNHVHIFTYDVSNKDKDFLTIFLYLFISSDSRTG